MPPFHLPQNKFLFLLFFIYFFLKKLVREEKVVRAPTRTSVEGVPPIRLKSLHHINHSSGWKLCRCKCRCRLHHQKDFCFWKSRNRSLIGKHESTGRQIVIKTKVCCWSVPPSPLHIYSWCFSIVVIAIVAITCIWEINSAEYTMVLLATHVVVPTSWRPCKTHTRVFRSFSWGSTGHVFSRQIRSA